MRTGLDPHCRIAVGCNGLGISQRSFAAIAGTPYSEFSMCMADQIGMRNLKPAESERLLDVLQELAQLQHDVNRKTGNLSLPLDWSRTDDISSALVIRRAWKIVLEFGDHTLDTLAENVMKGI